MNGGSLTVNGSLTGGAGTGTFNMTGGIVSVVNLNTDTGNAGVDFIFTGGLLAVDTVTGDLVNEGGILSPDNSPGTILITGNYTQSALGTLDIQLGGLLAGSEYDVLNINGTANLGGTLDVSWYDLGSGLFNASLGDSFDILTAYSLTGEFDNLTLAVLGNGLRWQLDYLFDEFGTTGIVRLTIVSAVPVPASVWLFGSGLIGLIGIAKRKKV